MVRVTAKDVARLAGVSQSTVSYVLNDTPGQSISAATRDRVLAAAAELRYTPSAAAQALRRGSSRTVLVVLPDAPIGHTIAALIERITDDMEPLGYSVVYRRHRDPDALERAWRELMPAAVGNLSALPEELEAPMRAAGIPVVHGGLDDPGLGRMSIAERPIGRLQAAHLLERGYRRIGYAAPADARVSQFYDRRLAGVREVCAAAGLPEPIVTVVEPDVAAAAAVMAGWRSGPDPVTGVAAYNDEVAIAMLAGIDVLGLGCPQDVGVIGVDADPLGAFTRPALTTVDIGVQAAADTMSRLLVEAVTHGVTPSRTVPEIPFQLVRRAST